MKSEIKLIIILSGQNKAVKVSKIYVLADGGSLLFFVFGSSGALSDGMRRPSFTSFRIFVIWLLRFRASSLASSSTHVRT